MPKILNEITSVYPLTKYDLYFGLRLVDLAFNWFSFSFMYYINLIESGGSSYILSGKWLPIYRVCLKSTIREGAKNRLRGGALFHSAFGRAWVPPTFWRHLDTPPISLTTPSPFWRTLYFFVQICLEQSIQTSVQYLESVAPKIVVLSIDTPSPPEWSSGPGGVITQNLSQLTAHMFQKKFNFVYIQNKVPHPFGSHDTSYMEHQKVKNL